MRALWAPCIHPPHRGLTVDVQGRLGYDNPVEVARGAEGAGVWFAAIVAVFMPPRVAR
jgi:hypothetical protein